MIREFNELDIPFIINELKYFNVEKNMDDIINHPFNKFLIYEFDNVKIGFLQYSFYYDRIEIDYILINEAYRKKGFAKKMLDFLISMYYNSGTTNITLEVSEKNIAAVKLYKSVGFETVAVRANYYGNGENGLLMMRRF